MTSKNESMQNIPLPKPDFLAELEKCTPSISKKSSVDLFVIHDEENDGIATNLTDKTQSGTSKESPYEADYNLYRMLLETKIAELSIHLAHEFNRPLGTILAYVQLLLAREKSDEVTKEGLRVIHNEAQCASAMVTALLSFARRNKPEKQLISIQDVVVKSLELQLPRLRDNNIEVTVKLQPDIRKTMADPHQMQQVFTSIIANAEQAITETHGKGNIYIKAQEVGEIIRITFEDNGTGIPPDILKHIFDPFFTTRDTGLGLGLSICYSIVEGHGGRIYATNKPDKGSSFVVEAPIVSQSELA